MKGKKTVIVLIIINTLFIGFISYLYLHLDKTAPVINIEESALSYSDDLSRDQLMKGVTAMDNTDGDVSNTLIIEKITTNSTKKQALIMYGARDKYGNVEKKARTLPYIPTTSEQESNQKAEEEQVKGNHNLEEETKSEKKVVEEEVTEEASSSNTTKKDLSNVHEQPKLTPKPENQDNRPVITFRTKEVNTLKNQNPAWVTVISELSDDKDSYEELLGYITIIGKYDNKVIGEYPVTVFVKDSDGNESEKNSITIKVGE